MLDLILSEIKDPHIKENFARIVQYISQQDILQGNWKFYELSFNEAVTQKKIPHKLSYIPRDIILLRIEGNHNVTFHHALFDKDNIVVSTVGPCRIKFLAGIYNAKERRSDLKSLDEVPVGVEGIITGPQGPQGPQGTQGIQGPTGPTGPGGPASTVALSLTKPMILSEDMSAGEWVSAINNTNIVKADPTSTEALATVLGMLGESGLTGETKDVIISGAVQISGFSFSVNDILLLDETGGTTITLRTTGFHTIVGKSLGGEFVFVDVLPPVTLEG